MPVIPSSVLRYSLTVLYCSVSFRGRVEETSGGDEHWDTEAGAWEREIEKTWPWTENEWNPKDQVWEDHWFLLFTLSDYSEFNI